MKKFVSAILAFAMVLLLFPAAFAAESGTLTIYKYDITTAGENGVTAGAYASTGAANSAAEAALAQYAIQGVVFSYAKIGELVQLSEANGGKVVTRNLVRLPMGTQTDTLLAALGLTAGSAYRTAGSSLDFQMDTLIHALEAKIASNSSALKDALEAIPGTAMPETNSSGKTSVSLADGVYLITETRVPEDVTSTTNPFIVTMPLMQADGTGWSRDVTVYPKNETGDPDLEKTVREEGKQEYAHSATASMGDRLEYQIISTLPAITSASTALTAYTFTDTLESGLEYCKNDVVLEWYKDAACTQRITAWDEADGKFTVSYTADGMQIAMTRSGLAEINGSTAVYPGGTFRGYSRCTLRITYSCILGATAQTGDKSNDNQVTLRWSRTNTDYYDTLDDCCHVYTYGMELAKTFSDNNGTFENVRFIAHNDSDNYYILADLENGRYTVTGHTENAGDATALIPNGEGKILLDGMEDDTYSITEIATDQGYFLLQQPVVVEIATQETTERCGNCGAKKLTAAATVDGIDGEMGENHAAVRLEVVNNRIPDLPQTGDTSALILSALGTVLFICALCCGAYVILSGKKHEA